MLVLAASRGSSRASSPRPALPTWAKIAVGALVLAAYWTYTLVLGRRAAPAGETGDLEQDLAGHTLAQAG